MKKRIALLFILIVSILASAVAQTYDICVYGGSSAGVIAAYTAKKAGKTVLLIEPGKHLGGLSSGGLGQTDIGNKYAITGIARDFYRQIGQHYGKFEQWTFEPHVAENLFKEYVKKGDFPVWFEYRLVSASKKEGKIQEITVESSNQPGQGLRTVKAKMFIDCTYEGDLMAKAGVSYIVGREANSQYNETWNGVQLLDKHQFPEGVDPYKIPGDPSSGLLWGISTAALAPNGSGDKLLQTYNFRLCLTKDPANRIPITRPDRYDSTKYELLLRQVAIEKPPHINWGVMHIADMPNSKTDINNKGGFSTDMIGMNHDYAEANYETRKKIIKDHEDYTKGFLYFVGHDPRMPEHLRKQMLEWGYPKDEYIDNDHFSPQLYVREARRLVGEYVMTQHNCEGREVVKDGIGLAAYTMDSHNCQRILFKNPKTGKMEVRNEGDVQVGGFPPYPISYRSLIPKKADCENLLVPVCLSATHIAYGSIRMEPVFMALAQASAVAAAMAIDTQKPVQEINVTNLQKALISNPLMDGSQAEILLDNDVTPTKITVIGNWKAVKTGGKYAATQLVDNSKGKEKNSVRFEPDVPQTGEYVVYVYNPSPTGGGGNPGEAADEAKASRTMVRVKTATEIKEVVVESQTQVNDWIKLGTYKFAKGSENFVEITNQNANGVVVADAVLFVPSK
ncbi:FAD-dependent oxidoreductase [Runella sp. CRIBMP]|uniref:FAD-dependent oxidoreductase n=1 Tax=Runella sp. CRIBMP TaxID=2683261 RepID=UPI0014137191|nr:FAD-dependent oxidoreductase [Runella sp. CRIBMP]NBB19763.1 FAD-dependent oxidoreductase [Runella sp. CRIBMP]